MTAALDRLGGGTGELTTRVLALALALGFDRAGVAPVEPAADTRFIRKWLAAGRAGEMHYLGAREAERMDPRVLMPSVASIVSVAFSYDPPSPEPERAIPANGRVAAYAGGEDYHTILIDRVRALATGVEALAGRPLETRPYVDTGPVQERVFAARAGLGWIGKNTLVIDPKLGSRMLLGVLLTDLVLEAGTPMPDHCGSCRACLDACPTDAFIRAYELDATRCIAYTTIETRGPIEPKLRVEQGNWIFGCDICQDVCPWNRRRVRGDLPDPLGLRERLMPDPSWVGASLRWVLSLDESSWREVTRGTALRRARYRGLLRNALIAAGNSRDEGLLDRLEAFAAGADEMLAEHARWALARITRDDP